MQDTIFKDTVIKTHDSSSINRNVNVPVNNSVQIIAPQKVLYFVNSHVIVKRWETNPEVNYDKFYIQTNWSDFLKTKNIIDIAHLKNKLIYSTAEVDSFKLTNNNLISNNLHQFGFSIGFQNFLLFILLFTFSLLAWIKISFGKYLNQLLESVIYYTEALKLFRDHNSLIARLFYACNLIFVLSGGIFCYFLLQYFKPEFMVNNQFLLIFYCFLFIIGIFFFKYVVNKIIGFILNHISAFNEYIHNIFSYYKAIGLFILPIVSIVPFISDQYRPICLLIGIIIIFSFYILSIFRTTKIMLQKDILLFYWILYLCVVEFLPIMLLYKLFNKVV